MEKQQQYIDTAQAELERLKQYEIFQLDASLFNPNNFE